MPKRNGRRIQIKKIKYQIKQCLIFNQDPFPFYLKLTKIKNPLSNHSKTISNHQILNYKLISLDLEINYPSLKIILKKRSAIS